MRRNQEVANNLRHRQTPAERKAWEVVRRKGILGLKFRRQHPIGGFIVDLYCAEIGLAIEIDGPIHLSSGRADAERTAVLEGLGVLVVRVKNEDVSSELLLEIIRAYRDRPRPRPPSPAMRERGRGRG